MSIKPKEIKEKDFTQAIKACNNYLNFLNSDDYNEDSLSNYINELLNEINEATLEAVFGKDCWAYINDKIE